MGMFRRLANNRDGTTAVELAFVGPPFLLLLAAIFELGLTLTAQSLLDGAARDAARLIRTGQVQTQGSPIGTHLHPGRLDIPDQGMQYQSGYGMHEHGLTKARA